MADVNPGHPLLLSKRDGLILPLDQRFIGEPWAYAHCEAVRALTHGGRYMEGGMVELAQAIGHLVLMMERAQGDRGPAGWKERWPEGIGSVAIGQLLSAFVELLNFDVGRIDCGTASVWASAVAARVGYSLAECDVVWGSDLEALRAGDRD